jgi:hypothetical protein
VAVDAAVVVGKECKEEMRNKICGRNVKEKNVRK